MGGSGPISFGEIRLGLIQFILGLVLAIATFAGVHEFGHWVIYEYVGASPCFQWMQVVPTGSLTASQQIFALHFGLLFQIFPGVIAAVYLVRFNPNSNVALGLLVASWLTRSLLIVMTLRFADSGDETAIQGLLVSEQYIGPALAWVYVFILAAVPAVLFVCFQFLRERLRVPKEWNNWVVKNWGVWGAIVGFIVASEIVQKYGYFNIWGACQALSG